MNRQSVVDTIDVAVTATQIVERLKRGEVTWARTPLATRAALLGEIAELVAEHAEEWVRIASEIKLLDPESTLTGEEWTSGPWATISYCRALQATLEALDAGRDPLARVTTRTTSEGQVALKVLPYTVHDRLLLSGFTAEVWMQPGIEETTARRSCGLAQRAPHETQGIALVLGAGNITSIAPLDALYVLFADNRAAALKLNPISDPLIGVYRAIFAPLLDLGVVEIISGRVEIATALVHHDAIDAVHMTGSEATHDAIVWGSGEEGLSNKAADTPLLTKPITSELGGVSPVIVVPGRWTRRDLRFQAQHVATLRLHNSGSNCVAAQMVILSSDWAQKDAFLVELRKALASAPERAAWYPGTASRVARARTAHPDFDAVGGTPLRTLIPGLDLTADEEPAFAEEFFGPVLGISELPGHGEAFLAAAVDAANDRLRGTLGANVIIDPRTAKRLGPGLERQVTRLRYGTIGINCWTALGYLTPHATWGAFPGHSLNDVQSGRGVVHNALLLDRTERTVVRGPFRPAPRSFLRGEWSLTPVPPWFVHNRTAHTTSRRLTLFSARRRWRQLPGIFSSAMRG